ncbi:MAG: ribbon-helix-helix domain-containing protein [Desulfatiglandales bacterium]
MDKDKKVFFNTTVSESLIKEFKILAIKQSKRQNQLLEEAMKDVLNKYGKKETKNTK